MRTVHTLLLALALLCPVLPLAAQIPLWEDASPSERKVTLTPFPADSATDTGIAVIVCPGGSYSWLDMQTEGVLVAQWLQRNGINAFVLRYRVANISAYCLWYRAFGLGNRYPDALHDVTRALQYLYENADRYRIRTDRIGVMGFSAGGHLAMSAYAYNHTPYQPAFLCPVYPVVTLSRPEYTHKRSRRGALGVWRQFNRTMRDSLSIEKHIAPDCPPVFLVNCEDDPVVRWQNSLLLDSALNAAGVPHRYIRYATGGHGFGASDTKGSQLSRQWKDEFLRWLRTEF